jgi:hypothetical protein
MFFLFACMYSICTSTAIYCFKKNKPKTYSSPQEKNPVRIHSSQLRITVHVHAVNVQLTVQDDPGQA